MSPPAPSLTEEQWEAFGPELAKLQKTATAGSELAKAVLGEAADAKKRHGQFEVGQHGKAWDIITSLARKVQEAEADE